MVSFLPATADAVVSQRDGGQRSDVARLKNRLSSRGSSSAMSSPASWAAAAAAAAQPAAAPSGGSGAAPASPSGKQQQQHAAGKEEPLVAPILVNCSGSSDESEPDQALGGGSRASASGSTTGLLAAAHDGASSSSGSSDAGCSSSGRTSGSSGGVPATWISEAEVQRGNFKTGVRYCMETWPDSLVMRGLDSFLAMSSMFGYTATILILVVCSAIGWWTSFWPAGLFAAALTLSVLLPPEPLLWEGFQRSTLVSSWRRYFRFSFVVDAKLDPGSKYVFAMFPHGVFPVAELLCISLLMRIWPALRVYSICASSVFHVPVWRHILSWTGARPATAHDFRALLARGSVSLVPGGIAEMFLWEERREVIKVRDRKGFVRLAVEQGVPLVPVYHFGNSRLFSWVAPRSWEVIARRTRTAVGYPKGRWLTLLPRNAPLLMAVGAPIPVPQLARGAPGYEAAVEAAHAALVRALEELYDRHKASYGWEDRPLVIV